MFILYSSSLYIINIPWYIYTSLSVLNFLSLFIQFDYLLISLYFQVFLNSEHELF